MLSFAQTRLFNLNQLLCSDITRRKIQRADVFKKPWWHLERGGGSAGLEDETALGDEHGALAKHVGVQLRHKSQGCLMGS
jgi:hypothetical protein